MDVLEFEPKMILKDDALEFQSKIISKDGFYNFLDKPRGCVENNRQAKFNARNSQKKKKNRDLNHLMLVNVDGSKLFFPPY